MKKLFKPFEELVFNLKNNLYFLTRLKLTLYYTLISTLLIASFSFITYQTFKSNLEIEVKDEYSVVNNQSNIVENTSDQTRNTIIGIDLGVLIFIGFLSYWSAGKTLRPIQKNMEIQQLFISDASHELRTPLAIMKSTLEVEIRKLDNPKKEKFKSLEEEVDRMTQIVNDLLTLSRLDQNQGLEFKQINILETVKSAIELMSSYAAKKDISIHIIDSENTHLTISGDNQKLLQVFLNLLKNAVDYSGVKSTVKVTILKKDGFVEINIKDNGIGIKEGELTHIFDRFYRVDSSRSRNSGGSGLGLAIAKEIINLHRGSIKVNSESDKGSIFSVLLPINS